MRHRELIVWETAGWIVTMVGGVALHFVFNWSGRQSLVGVVSAVNESTWEHMKILFVPMFLFSVVQLFGQEKPGSNFLAVRAGSILAGMAAIPVLFYTYTGILGRSVPWVNILIFALAALGTILLDYRWMSEKRFSSLWQQILGLLALWGIVFLVVYWTFHPPMFPLWQDPVTLQYGI